MPKTRYPESVAQAISSSVDRLFQNKRFEEPTNLRSRKNVPSTFLIVQKKEPSVIKRLAKHKKIR